MALYYVNICFVSPSDVTLAVRVFSQQASGSVGDAPSQPTSDDATAAALETALLSQVLIYPNAKKNEQTKTTSSPSSGLPEEELITSQEWSCYGSTELDLLVLRPQGETEEKIVAVCVTYTGENEVTISILTVDSTNCPRLPIAVINNT